MSGSGLVGHDIVCLAHEPWHGPWKTYQQIMSRLARSNRVFYVGPPASLREAARSLRARTGWAPVLERVGSTLTVYHEPRVLARARPDGPLGRAVNGLTSGLRLAHARWLARCLGMTAPILWIFDPMQADAAGTFGEKMLIYHVLDNYVEFFDADAAAARAAAASGERRLLERADLVFAVSESLRDRCAALNGRVFHVPNGVDYDGFQAAIAGGEAPPDMRAIPRPVMGYVGAIQPIVDFSLLEHVADRCREWSLVLVGPDDLGGDRRRFEALLARPNVFYLGCKPVDAVPGYIHACDVCIVPYDRQKGTVPDSDSIKLYEYLAVGRPVVSVDVASVRRFAAVVRIARGPEEFVVAIRRSLADDPQLAEWRKAAAREETWQRRVDAIGAAVAPRLRRGTGAAPPCPEVIS